MALSFELSVNFKISSERGSTALLSGSVAFGCSTSSFRNSWIPCKSASQGRNIISVLRLVSGFGGSIVLIDICHTSSSGCSISPTMSG